MTTSSIKPNTQHVDIHEQFGNIFDDNYFSQIVKEPTRLNNTLDLIVTNNPSLINRVEVIPGISDHDAVFAEVDISPRKNIQKPRIIPLFKKADWEGMRSHCDKLSQDSSILYKKLNLTVSTVCGKYSAKE